MGLKPTISKPEFRHASPPAFFVAYLLERRAHNRRHGEGRDRLGGKTGLGTKPPLAGVTANDRSCQKRTSKCCGGPGADESVKTLRVHPPELLAAIVICREVGSNLTGSTSGRIPGLKLSERGVNRSHRGAAAKLDSNAGDPDVACAHEHIPRQTRSKSDPM